MITQVISILLIAITIAFASAYLGVIGSFNWGFLDSVFMSMTGGILSVSGFVTVFIAVTAAVVIVYAIKACI